MSQLRPKVRILRRLVRIDLIRLFLTIIELCTQQNQWDLPQKIMTPSKSAMSIKKIINSKINTGKRYHLLREKKKLLFQRSGTQGVLTTANMISH